MFLGGLHRFAGFARHSADADILVVTNAWPSEERPAYGIFIFRQVQSAIALGQDCDVLVIRGRDSAAAYVLAALRLLAWSLRGRPRYRLVHAHGGEAAIAARFYLRAPLLISYLGSDILGWHTPDGRLPRRQRLRAVLLRQWARLSAATITKSREMEGKLPGSVRARNTVLPNGVDRDLFAPLPRTQARAELGWDARAPTVLFAANPEVRVKRFPLAQAAYEVARAHVPDLRLEIGWGIDPARMPLLMSAADCMVHTSVTEGSSNVIKEALACDLPVIAVAAGDAPELLAAVRGCAVCEATPEALGHALVTCVRAGARSDGRERTAWLEEGVVARRLVDLYVRLQGARR